MLEDAYHWSHLISCRCRKCWQQWGRFACGQPVARSDKFPNIKVVWNR
jgi:hypothetical protein